ncbi:Uncharacterised protein [Brevundimonas diminuta]|uniref:hypothetical protein n=1 Tax=Brevundimonas diminuta TaxID=293 RepID=UPI000D93486D|nr:hypothetical protein [Brevundimonas diminuta]SPU44802.1 Uncharacterised protein [Brevundimonas diminuta]
MQTIYRVQTYRRQGRRLEAGQMHQFADEAAARAAGISLSGKAAGVVVYAISGEPEADFWDEPMLLSRHGVAPEDREV